MGYWMVVPNTVEPSLAVHFEVFGDVQPVRTVQEAMNVEEAYGVPFAVVIGVPVDGLAQRVEWFRHRFPGTHIYLAGAISPYQLAGLDVTNVVPLPLPPEFIKTVELESDSASGFSRGSSVATATTLPRMETETPKEPTGKDQIIVVFSGKGGDGKTTVAAQLGILLAKRGIATLIIDADYKGNEAEWFRGMNQPPIHSILDFREDESKDRALIESFLMEKDGLKVLPCPQVEVGPIHPNILERAIQAYKPFYPVIILDMHQGFSPELLLASQYANKFVAVTVPSEHRLYPFSMTVGQLLSHRVSKKNLHIVVNRSHRGEADIRKIRTGIQDILGGTFGQYHMLPFVGELSEDDDPEFVAIQDLKSSEPYPVAFTKMAEAITGLSLSRKGESKKTSGKKESKGSWRGVISKFIGPSAPAKKPSKKKGGGKR